MAKCEYKTRYWRLGEKVYYKCPHNALKKPDKDGKKHCIYHSKSEEKKHFYHKFINLYKKKEYNYTGFVFPKDFSFEIFRKEAGPLRFKNAVFVDATFLSDADFGFAQFSGERGTSFRRAKFFGDGNTNFSMSKFTGEMGTDFSRVQFIGNKNIFFLGTEFHSDSEITFSGAKFFSEGEKDFTGAEFKSDGGTFFDDAEFTGAGETDFVIVIFSGKGRIIFSGIKFSCENGVYFNGSNFAGEDNVIFEGKTFYDGTKATFKNVSFKEPDNVNFNGVDLNHCSFIGTDLSEVKFYEVFWFNQKYAKKVDSKEEFSKEIIEELEEKTYNEIWEIFSKKISEKSREVIENKGDNRLSRFIKEFWNKIKEICKNIFKRIMIYDEILQKGYKKNEGNDEDHYLVQQLYNQLRLNYERTGRYHEAGDFFVGAMEMRRKGTREKWIIRKALTLYKCISLYGERPFRAFLWLIGLWFLFGLFYIFAGLEINPDIKMVGKLNTINRDIFIINMKVIFDFLKYFFRAIILNFSILLGIKCPFFAKKLFVDWTNYMNSIWFFLKDLGYGLLLSLRNLTLGRTETIYVPINKTLGAVLNAFELLLGAIIIPLFILAMNRKFRRTKD